MAMAQGTRKAYLGGRMSTTTTINGPGGTPEVSARGRERWVNGLIGAGHFRSHYYLLALPPVFPVL